MNFKVMYPIQFSNVIGGEVKIGKYVQLGGNTIVLPNIVIKEGVFTGIVNNSKL